MENLLDMKSTASLLANPQAWQLVCNALPIEATAVDDPIYAQWASQHLDQHTHPEILFCLDGETCEHFNGCNYLCRPGTLFFFDAGDSHALGYPLDGRSFVHIWLRLLTNDIIAHTFTRHGHLTSEACGAPLVLAGSERDHLQHHWQLASKPPLRFSLPLRRATLLSALHVAIMHIFSNWLSPSTPALSLRHQSVVSALQRHIETHLADDCNLDSLARLSGYSKFHFCRIFKEYSGETVLSFINRCRINHARKMTANGALQKEIAAALGFASPTAFSNWRTKNLPS